MAVFALSVTKDMQWRGATQAFSNVYHYRTDAGQTFDDEMVIDAVVAAEKAIHASSVSFRNARTWGPTDGPKEGSVTRVIRDLSGAGAEGTSGEMYREGAHLIVWPLGRYGSRNRPQFLRKYLHLVNLAGVVTTGWMNGSVSTPTTPAQIQAYIDAVQTVSMGVNGVAQLTTARDRGVRGDGYLYPYLEHHQLGDQWR